MDPASLHLPGPPQGASGTPRWKMSVLHGKLTTRTEKAVSPQTRVVLVSFSAAPLRNTITTLHPSPSVFSPDSPAFLSLAPKLTVQVSFQSMLPSA